MPIWDAGCDHWDLYIVRCEEIKQESEREG